MRIPVRVPAAVAAAFVCAVALAGCTEPGDDTDTSPTSTAPTPTDPDVSAHESGPQSPIGYGLEVPIGATQLGPLVRLRSPALIDAYTEDLEAAQAARDAAILEEAQEEAGEGVTPTTPTPTPDDPPSDDSFKLLEDSPRPDTTISVMRIDGDPGQVTRRMLAQFAALLPDAEVPTDDLASVCPTENDRVVRCAFDTTGTTPDGREVRLRLAVDPGELTTRTAPPSALTNPVMMVSLVYVGDPIEGQENRESNDLTDVEDVDEVPDNSGLIWPSMDIDAPPTTPLVDGWVAPATSTILLSGYNPSFVALHVDRATSGDAMARDWVANHAGEVDKDVVEDLNEVSTTYTGRGDDGAVFRATHVLSARGNYVAMFIYPRA